MAENDFKCHVALVNKEGLHARPAQMVVQKANGFESRITLRIGELEADAKSIFEVMMLASPAGQVLEIEASGPDAEAAARALRELVGQGFGEEPA